MGAEIISIVKTPHYCELPISEIVVQGRHRSDLGDIKALAESIQSLGLINAVTVTPDHHLLAGERRLAALRMLGRAVAPVVVIHNLTDAADRLRAERDENTCRKAFTTTELVSIGRRIEELERPKAKERQLGGLRQGGQTPLGSIEPNGKTNEVVADALGVSPSTYKRAKTVVNATEDADPSVAEVAREQLAKLDAGETSYTAADQAVRDARNGKKEAIDFNDPLVDAEVPEPEVIPGLPTKVKGPRQNHLKMLTRIVVGLSGTAMALDGIEEVNDTVNAEEARRLMSDLSPSIRSLNRINKLLKERTK
ncbi:ParB/RepB/Spo0J family partition protein [Mycolicibacterium peregrinum]|uniref:ParB/RepB/Spo0J family partition protein n=1 Tax=Mycolicibacterium peregrinum TaxID=43304 RepID=UPI003AB0A8B3